MNFEQDLTNIPVSRLKQITANRLRSFRGVPRISNKKELVKFLASALSSYESVTRSINNTSLPELQMLSALASRGGSVGLRELLEDLDEFQQSIAKNALDGLE